jgi:hypothetical protein
LTEFLVGLKERKNSLGTTAEPVLALETGQRNCTAKSSSAEKVASKIGRNSIDSIVEGINIQIRQLCIKIMHLFTCREYMISCVSSVYNTPFTVN